MQSTEPAVRVTSDDPRYRTLAAGFNQRWVGHPRYVEVVADVDQIVEAVQRCVDEGLRPTVRSGGHCYEGWSSLTDGVIIDVSLMQAAGRDAETGWYFLETGCTNWDVYNQLYRRYGVTLPAGSCYSVGAGGHICGGGYGLLSCLHGLTVDWLQAVEVVCVGDDRRARLVRATRDADSQDEQDLFWAHTGGGGGNFGVITKYFFKDLPPGPSEAWLASVAWEWSDLVKQPDSFRQLLRNFGRFFEEHSAPGSPYSSLFALFHLTRLAAGQIVLTVQNAGPDRAPVEDFLQAVEANVDPTRLRSVVPRVAAGWHHYIPVSTSARRMPWLEVTQTLNGSGANQRGKYKSAYMKRAFPDSQLETIWKWLTVDSSEYPPNKSALLQVDSYGCKINEVGPQATAVPQRSSILKLQYQTYWSNPGQDDDNLRWIRDFYSDMYGTDGPVPDEVVDGCYVNYCDSDLGNWADLYYQQNYSRLQRAKVTWDRNNIFNHAQSIQPPR